MNKLVLFLTGPLLATLLTGSALAQSSGNFSAVIDSGSCALSSSDGSLSGGAKPAFHTTIQTPNDTKTTLLITPSLFTGLFTDSYITTNNDQESVDNESAAVLVTVLFDGNPVPPETADNPSVVYDKHYQQISTQLFSQLDECRNSNNQQCDFRSIQSMLSAHSFNFIVPSPGVGSHTVDVNWQIACTKDGQPVDCSTTPTQSGAGNAGACVGPGVLTVQQTKAFSQSGGINLQ